MEISVKMVGDSAEIRTKDPPNTNQKCCMLSTLSRLSLSIYLWLYSPCGPWPLFQFLNPYTVHRTPWAGDQTIARPYLHTEKHKHRIDACFQWDSNSRTQCSSSRRRSVPYALVSSGSGTVIQRP
jgi:hypothetical protein